MQFYQIFMEWRYARKERIVFIGLKWTLINESREGNENEVAIKYANDKIVVINCYYLILMQRYMKASVCCVCVIGHGGGIYNENP